MALPSKQAFYSKHIFPDDTSPPIDGFLLLNSSQIDSIIPINETTYLLMKNSLISEGYEIFEYSEFYICPGIIDSHVSFSSNYDEIWQDITNITRMAASGGITTVIDHPSIVKYNANNNEVLAIKERIEGLQEKLCVDCGILANLTNSNMKFLEEIMNMNEVLGLKYSFQPSFLKNSYEEKINFKEIFQYILGKMHVFKEIVLFLFCEKANFKDLFSSSPCRNDPLTKRIDLSHDISRMNEIFAGGFSQTIGQEDSPISSNASENEDEEEIIQVNLQKSRRMTKEMNEIDQITEEIKRKTLEKLQIDKNTEKIIENERKNEKFDKTDKIDKIPRKSQEKYEIQQITEKIPSKFLNNDKKSNFSIYTDLNSGELKKLSNQLDEKKTLEHLRNAELCGYQHEDLGLILENIEEDQYLIYTTDEELKKSEESASPLNEDFESKMPSNNNFSTMSIENNASSSELYENSKPFCLKLRLLTKNSNFAKDDTIKDQLESESAGLKIHDIIESPLKTNKKRFSLLDRRNISPIASPLLPFSMEIQTPKLDFYKNQQKNSETTGYEKEIMKKYEFFLANRPANLERMGIRLLFKEYSLLENSQKSSIHIILSNLSLSSSCSLLKDQKKLDISMKIFSDVGLPFLALHDKKIKNGYCQYKSSPPIRDKENSQYLKALLIRNSIDMASSAHIRVPFKYKIIDEGNFRRAFSGLSSIGVNLQIMWTFFYLSEKKSLKNQFDEKIKLVIKLLSVNPAKILRISEKKGSLNKGKDADFYIWKPFEIVRMRKENILLKDKSLFVFRNQKFYGKVYKTYLRGWKVWDEAEKEERTCRGVIIKRN